MNNIGDRIKQKRKELGFTQAELGEKLNITDRAVSKWEQGEGDPNLSIIPDIAKALGVSLDYLLLGKEEEPAITLDDMEAEKRLSLLIKKDDAKNFKKYEYQKSAYVFGRTLYYGRNYNVEYKEPNAKTWLEIINAGAKKIFGVCCDELIKMNTQKVWAAFLVYGFIDEFVKMVVDCDRPDVLETIGFRVFAVGTKPLNSKEIPFAYPRDLSHYISEVDTYFITQETFEYFFKNRKTSPNCFDYATSFEFQIVPLKNKYNQCKEYTYTHLHNDIVAMAIKYGMFDVLDKVISSYKEELYSENLPKYEYNRYNMSYQTDWINTYVTGKNQFGDNRVYGRVLYFKETDIKSLIEKGNLEYAKKLNDYNGEVIARMKSLNFSSSKEFEKVFHLNEKEMNRAVKLNSNLPEDEMAKVKCVNNKIIIPNEIRKLRDLKLVRELLDNNYYHYYEFVYDSISRASFKDLFEFFVDNGFEDLAKCLMNGDCDFKRLLSRSWMIFNLKSGYAGYEENKKIINNQNSLNVKNYGMINYDGKSINISSEYGVIENNKIIEYIKSLKEDIYKDVENKVNAELKDKQDAIERAKIVKGLNKDYFEGLLAKKGLFSKKEQRLFILDLCSLLDAIFKFDYKCDGEDFYERMTCFFNRMSENAPKSRDIDDGWGYMVLDQAYENDVVVPERNRIEHLTDIFNRLRIQRNNIAHSESKKVQELNEAELRECLEFVFSINKEGK